MSTLSETVVLDALRVVRDPDLHKDIVALGFVKGLRIDDKDTRVLGNFITDRGKIISSRITGNCARHQRRLTTAIKQARSVALLPFAAVM